MFENIEEWNSTSWNHGNELPVNNAANTSISPQNISSSAEEYCNDFSPSPRFPVQAIDKNARFLPLKGRKEFVSPNDTRKNYFKTANTRQPLFTRAKKQCHWEGNCRQAQLQKAGIGNDKDEDHLRFFFHPDQINDPPFIDCKNGEVCWALSARDKAVEEKEEIPIEVKRHCFFFHRA